MKKEPRTHIGSPKEPGPEGAEPGRGDLATKDVKSPRSPGDRSRGAPGRVRPYARTVVGVLNGSAIAVGCWALLDWRNPYVVAAALGFPTLPLVTALLGRGAVQLLGRRGDSRPSLWIALLVPVVIPAFHVLRYRLVAPAGLVLPALACGVVLTGIGALGDRALRRASEAAALLVLMVATSALGLTFANCARDTSPVTEYQTTLLDKRIVGARGGGSPTLTLAPWGPHTGTTEENVSRAAYESLTVGQRMWLCVRAGRLGMPWISASPRGSSCL